MPTAAAINDLRIPPSNHLELLKGKLAGYYSIRVNAQYRLIFHWSQQQQEAYDVYFDDYHH
ncbi:type II toxin-antitoxin system RelE/ParE family toxin [Bifidobacterium pseudolongum]|uniref:type II toxin-antitoxin system RelE/ParE family toxin n=1 Tax=Bifidobacterium pseudolongum TaxID=1694 RepID=UPI001021E0D0|nr:type II toxin-antitoxin system RelE/ParE family toxin [Bifidobacterium pseudolongum]RYQ43168.1 plasmid maintenance system killer protein [Bifidobacterium pseudolongum subsp. globosum]